MFEVAILYTLVIAVELAPILVKSLDVYYYFHDRFDASSVGKPSYLGPQSWRRILRGAIIIVVPLLIGIWVLDYLNEFYAMFGGLIGVFLYSVFLRGLISDEISEKRVKDWRYGWF